MMFVYFLRAGNQLFFLFYNKLVASSAGESFPCFENDLVFEITVNGIW